MGNKLAVRGALAAVLTLLALCCGCSGGLPDAPDGCAWDTETEKELLEAINSERVFVGAPELTLDAELAGAARQRAAEIYTGGCFEHSRPDKSKWHTVLEERGIAYAAAGENLAWSNRPTGEAVSAERWLGLWKESDSHYAAMINPKYTHVGLAVINCPRDDSQEQAYLVGIFCSY